MISKTGYLEDFANASSLDSEESFTIAGAISVTSLKLEYSVLPLCNVIAALSIGSVGIKGQSDGKLTVNKRNINERNRNTAIKPRTFFFA